MATAVGGATQGPCVLQAAAPGSEESTRIHDPRVEGTEPATANSMKGPSRPSAAEAAHGRRATRRPLPVR